MISSPLSENLARTLTEDGTILERQPQVLREARLTGAKEARYPDRDPFVRLVGRLRIVVEDLHHLVLDGIRHDVLAKLFTNDLFVGLVDLDHLLDASGDVVCEKVLDCLVSHHAPLEDLWPVVVFCVEHAHEAEAGSAVEFSWVEEDGGDVDLALELFE